MKKILIISVLVFVSEIFAGGFEQCPNIISSDIPEVNVSGSVNLCRKAYAVDYDMKNKIPVYTAYDLTPAHAIGCLKRANKFKKDPDIESAFPEDFKDSGYDRGHMAPNADFEWDKDADLQSFYMTNISPQLPGLNRRSWERLETTIRAWAISMDETLTVFTGTIYKDQSPKLKNIITIPDGFFKIVIFNKSKFALAFIYSQSNKVDLDIADFQVSIDDIEKRTNLVFTLPFDKKIKSKIPLAPRGIVSRLKHKACNI